MQLLHEYNEIKDIGQMLFGQCAMLTGVTVRDVYRQFDMNLDD
jgi:hypothetical protein